MAPVAFGGLKHAAGIGAGALVLATLWACQDATRSMPNGALRAEGPFEEGGPVRMETLDPKDQPPTYVMRGGPRGSALLVFLHGMCGHALGYAQAFQFAAAAKGTLIAPQGDKPCNGPYSSWSNDIDAIDERIVAAFRALDHAEPEDIVAIGYSQGATRAEALARKWPRRYSRLVLMAAPTLASPQGLGALRGAVTMAGELDPIFPGPTFSRSNPSVNSTIPFLPKF